MYFRETKQRHKTIDMKYGILIGGLVGLILIASSCEKDKYFTVPESVEPHISSFEILAEKHGYKVNIEETGITVKLEEINSLLQRGEIFYSDPVSISLNKYLWESYNDEDQKLQLYYFLSLGFLNRQDKSELFPNGEWNSIMRAENSYDELNENVNIFGFRQTYYFNELFNPNEEAPWWADYSADYDSIHSIVANMQVMTFDLENYSANYNENHIEINYIDEELVIHNKELKTNTLIFEDDILPDSNRDFFLECIYKSDELVNSENSDGFIFGYNEEEKYYSVQRNDRGESRFVNHYEPYTYYDKNSVSDTHILNETYNKISILKIDNNYTIFINENFIYITDIHSLYGQQIGFIMSDYNKLTINRINIYYLT